MTQDLVPVKPPGTALAVIAPKPSLSPKEIAWAEAQIGEDGYWKDEFSSLGLAGTLPFGLMGIMALVAAPHVTIPVVALGIVAPICTGRIAFTWHRRSKKTKEILAKHREDVAGLVAYMTERAQQTLREAVETGAALQPGMDLPVKVDTVDGEAVWKLLHIADIKPNMSCDSAGRVFSSELVVTAKLHDASVDADGTLKRGEPAIYKTVARSPLNNRVRGYVPPVTTTHGVEITHTITLKAPVELPALVQKPVSAPQADAAPPAILAAPPREVAPAFAPARPPRRPSDDPGAKP